MTVLTFTNPSSDALHVLKITPGHLVFVMGEGYSVAMHPHYCYHLHKTSTALFP